MIELDGSYGEGGGAILRVAAGLSVVTGKSIKIDNIRANRPKPGLKAQHLFGLKAVEEVCGGTLKGAELGSTAIEFVPGTEWKERIKVNIPTAGSIGLVMQILQIACMRASKPVKVEFNGGASYGKWAPPLDYLKNVLSKHVYRSGYKISLHIEKHGFYPVGGAIASAIIHPVKALGGFELKEPGKVEKIAGISVASRHLEQAKVAERQKKSSRTILFNKLHVSPEIETLYVDSDCPGSGLTLWAETDSGCILGADCVGEKGLRAEVVGENATKDLVQEVSQMNTVDRHLADQLVPFMALSSEPSQIRHSPVTKHTETNIWVVERFLGKKFRVKEGVISTL